MRAAAGPRAVCSIALLLASALALVEATGRVIAAPLTTQQQTTSGADVTWDFETGDLRGWTASGAAFAFQPTRGDNPAARQSTANHQGDYWIGTYEQYQGGPAETAGTTQGTRPQGTLESPAFEIPPGPLSFLVGGGAEFATRVELVVISAAEGESRALHATGAGTDAMQRVTWDLTPFAGQRGRIRVVDGASGDGGYINVDDIRFASVTVPNVVGRDEATARGVLEGRGLTLGAVERVESRVAEGRVLTQDPGAGARVEPGAPIAVGVAQLARVPVPDLVGRPESDVDRLLDRAELSRGQIRREESRRPPGTVVSHAPPADARVPIDTAVDVVVAVPVTVVVPDLVGRGADDANRLLADAELEPGRMRREESRRPRGTVLSQAPSSGDRVAIETAVDLVVATPVTVRVPDLVGREVTDADARLREAELRRGRTATEESREPEGTVLAHDPAASRRVAIETDVDLIVATPVTVLVPDLVGRDEPAVDDLLLRAELTRGTLEREESREPVGTVLTQTPAAGTRVVVETPVALVFAVPLTVVMPDVAGLAEAEALELLDVYELGLGVLAHRESPTDIGRVLEQWPAAGTRIDIGTGIDLVVAAVETVETPTVVGLSVDAARQVLTALRLDIGDETRQPSRTVEDGIVLEQHPPAATRVAVGSAVGLVVAEPEMVAVPAIVGLDVDDVTGTLGAAGLVAGLVERRFSLTPGGTVLSQSQPEGTLLEFGTPLPFGVARDRVTWLGPLGALLLVGVVGLVVRRARSGSTKGKPSRSPARREATAGPAVGVRGVHDAGSQGIPDDARPTTRVAVRLRPLVDHGTQQIEVEGTAANLGRLIARERRQP